MTTNAQVKSENGSLDVLWGAAEIGRFIRKGDFWTYTALKRGRIPATRVGGQWVASKAKLSSFLAAELEVC